jgi:hypothetical protein
VVNEMLVSLTNEILANKLIDTKTLNLLKKLAFEKLSNEDKVYNTNLMKKLNHFLETICKSIFRMNEFENANKFEILEIVYQNLLRKGAHYLRQDSLQVLRREMEIFEIRSDLEGKFIFKLDYLFKTFRERYLIN